MSKEQEILAQTIEQLERMNRVLAHLREEVLPKDPRLFALMVEGPLDEISRLRTQIEEQSRALVAA